jgi:predicted nuclease of predicted toxin-antitoxin system
VTETEHPTFFIDRALGKNLVANALRNAGALVEVHDDHFAPDAPDTDWLPEVSQRGWIVLTRDARIGLNILEQVAIASSEARVFVVSIDNATGDDMAKALTQALPKMERLTQSHRAPFIAKVYEFGKVRMWKDQRKMLKIWQ